VLAPSHQELNVVGLTFISAGLGFSDAMVLECKGHTVPSLLAIPAASKLYLFVPCS